MVKLAVPQVFLGAGFGLVFWTPAAWSNGSSLYSGSPVLLPPAGGGLAGLPLPLLPRGGICCGRRADLHWHMEKKCQHAVLDPSASGLGRGATHLFPACALTRVAVVENFPKVFLRAYLGATHQTAGEQLPEFIICIEPPSSHRIMRY